MSSRTFKVLAPHMRGADIKQWQATLNAQLQTWKVDYQILEDGDYGVTTRDLTATVLYGLGIPRNQMKAGVTAGLRVKVRNKRLSPTELARFAARKAWRLRLRKQHRQTGVAAPLRRIISSSWGYHPPVHDGVDLICEPNAALYALCDAEVIRADTGGWWGKGAPTDLAVRGRGDGIIVLRCTTDAGPFRKGLRFCYGHAEHPVVKVGQPVRAGQHIGTAGLANAWHVHFMANGRADDRGVGDRDPMPYVNYAVKHSR